MEELLVGMKMKLKWIENKMAQRDALNSSPTLLLKEKGDSMIEEFWEGSAGHSTHPQPLS